MMTTHNMPLNYLIDQLKEDIGEVIFLGIQPDIVGFYYPMTQPIKDAGRNRLSTTGRLGREWRIRAVSGGRRVVRRQTCSRFGIWTCNCDV
ncbi:hydrogenase 3 maturation protease [Escherichia coli]|uniref:Hydrogenase 3 maturation protease n=1 Tax=Escherichia coli TaxID=562 RepID=A0A377D6S0_ECOLX|nr:hydrogenase 3 maturation protease [Escherichia coli]